MRRTGRDHTSSARSWRTAGPLRLFTCGYSSAMNDDDLPIPNYDQLELGTSPTESDHSHSPRSNASSNMNAPLPIGSMSKRSSAHEHFNWRTALNHPAAIPPMRRPSRGRPAGRRSTRSRVRTTTPRYDTASHRRRPNEGSPDCFVGRSSGGLKTSTNRSRRLKQFDQIA